MNYLYLENIFDKFHASKLFVDENFDAVYYRDVSKLLHSYEITQTRRRLVFCLLGNDIYGLTGYLALLAAGAVPLMLSSNINVDQFKSLLHLYKPSYVWMPNDRIKELIHSELMLEYRSYSLFNNLSENYSIDNEVALLMSTSGSTGSPKYVKQSYKNIVSNAESIAEYLQLDSEEIPITTLPPNYTYGLSIIHSHILRGSTIAVTSKTFFDKTFWDFFRDVKATSFGGVPYHYEILKKLKFTKMNLPSLRTLTQAGGRMDPELTKEFANYCMANNKQFFTMYGQTEATARMSYLLVSDSIEKAGSIGKPISNGSFILENSDGEIVDWEGEPGELIYLGPNVSLGYAENWSDLSNGDELNGILRTGDVAMRDLDGFYYIVGRKKRFIKIFGNRINLQDIEDYLLSMGHKVACTGLDDRLEIYTTDADSPCAINLKKLISSRIQMPLSSIVIMKISSIPLNESGKIQYADLSSLNGTVLA